MLLFLGGIGTGAVAFLVLWGVISPRIRGWGYPGYIAALVLLLGGTWAGYGYEQVQALAVSDRTKQIETRTSTALAEYPGRFGDEAAPVLENLFRYEDVFLFVYTDAQGQASMIRLADNLWITIPNH